MWDPQIWRADCTALYKGLEHPWILVSIGGPETSSLWILSITSEVILSSSRLISWALDYNTRAFWRINVNTQTFYCPLPITNYPKVNDRLLPFMVSLSLEFRNIWFWLEVSHENTVIRRFDWDGMIHFQGVFLVWFSTSYWGRPHFLFMWASPKGCLSWFFKIFLIILIGG